MQCHFSDILRHVWPFVTYIIMKALNGFLMISRHMTLKIIMLESFIGHACRTVS